MMFLVFFHSSGEPLQHSGILDHISSTERNGISTLGPNGALAFIATGYDGTAHPAAALKSYEQNRFFIGGKIRLDGRADLRSKVRGSDLMAFGNGGGDPDLCLSLYARWGDAFLEHIRGEYSFCLWDDKRQRLIGVIDHLATRPLYWATSKTRTGKCWIIGNSLGRLAAIPGVNRDLDEYWVADYLSNHGNLDQERTIYRGVRRVPAAHYLIIEGDRARLDRYWQATLIEPTRHLRPSCYVEEFHDRLGKAIADRLPPGKVGIAMSGGLDSSTLAAKVVEITGAPDRVVAQTKVFASVIPDDEAAFSRLVSSHLGIEHRIEVVDNIYYDFSWWDKAPRMPEPTVNEILYNMNKHFLETVGKEADVWLYGEGPDNALTFEWRPYLRWQYGNGDILGAAMTLGQFLWTSPGRDWRTAFDRLRKWDSPWIDSPKPRVPEWIDGAFAHRVGLESRIMRQYLSKVAAHPWRPKAISSFGSSSWASLCEDLDSSILGGNVEWRHPFLDLRVLEFMLATPPLPWSRNKHIFRVAMKDRLPKEILRRPKTPLRAEPAAIFLEKSPLPPLPKKSPVRNFVDVNHLLSMGTAGSRAYDVIRIYALDRWLRHHGY